jgi:hypothetical protein
MACFPRGNTRRPPHWFNALAGCLFQDLQDGRGILVCVYFSMQATSIQSIHSTYKRKARMRWEPVYLPVYTRTSHDIVI